MGKHPVFHTNLIFKEKDYGYVSKTRKVESENQQRKEHLFNISKNFMKRIHMSSI